MSSRLSLLGLPSEVRLAIYREYFTLPGGYILSPNLRQLATSTGDPIELHLMFTCKLIAREASGIPLMVNLITFSTIHSDYLNLTARLFSEFCHRSIDTMCTNLDRLCGLINHDIYTMVLNKFPFFKQRMDHLRQVSQGLLNYPSTTIPAWSDVNAMAYALQLIISHHDPHIIEQTESELVENEGYIPARSSASMTELIRVRLGLQNWTIPTHDQVNDMINILPQLSDIDKKDYRKHRFSATAAAIFFLNSLPSKTRHQIRHIGINEDAGAVQYPEKHVRGLIPFCIENPQLQIDRRIDLWRNIFPKTILRRHKSYKTRNLDPGLYNLAADMAAWLAGTLSLTSKGMPSDSMTTFFDASPAPELCLDLFQKSVRRDVALIYAARALFAGEFDPDWSMKEIAYEVEPRFWHRFEYLELGLECLMYGSDNIRCNFDPGQKCDVDSIRLEIPHHQNLREWILEYWVAHLPTQSGYAVFSQWHEIVGENYFTQDELDDSINNGLKNGFPNRIEVPDDEWWS